jgi:hypothetical protein
LEKPSPTDLVLQFEKMTVNLKIGHRSDLGIKGLRNLGIEGILSILIN